MSTAVHPSPPLVAVDHPAQAGTIHWLNECIGKGKLKPGYSEVTLLTPGLAAELLKRNESNRAIRLVKLEQFKHDIRAGRWSLNGETLIISDQGTMNDGQHRCRAVIETQTPIKVLMVFGMPVESRMTLDQGTARTAADYLGMDGTANATVQASIARQVLAYERADGRSLLRSHYIPNGDIRERVLTDHKIGKATYFAVHHRKDTVKFASPSIIGFCYYVLDEICPVDAKDYMTQVTGGEGLQRKDPAYAVRARLLEMGKTGLASKAHVIFRGWNAYREGRPLTIVKILSGLLPTVI